MAKSMEWEIDNDILTSRRYDETVILSLKENLLFRLIDLPLKNLTFNYLDQLSSSEAIKLVVILTPPEGTGRAEYRSFYRKFYTNMDRSAVLRMYNAINQLVLKIVESPKMFIHAFRGKNVLMMLNLGLACDYRVVAESAMFQNPCMELGLLPKGGGAFFLTKMLGPGKAYEVLLSCEDITAEKAKTMGLVEKVVPDADLEEYLLTLAQSYCVQPANSLAGVKRLISHFHAGLKDFLERENQELIKIFDSASLVMDEH